MSHDRSSILLQRLHMGRCHNLEEFKRLSSVDRAAFDAQSTAFERWLDLDLPAHLDASAPRRLAFPSRVSDDDALQRHTQANWYFVDSSLRSFFARLCEALRRGGMPFYAHRAFDASLCPAEFQHGLGAAFDLRHMVYGTDLRGNEWAWVHKIAQNVHLRMMRDLPKADRWELHWGNVTPTFSPSHFARGGYSIPSDMPRPLQTRLRYCLTPRGILQMDRVGIGMVIPVDY